MIRVLTPQDLLPFRELRQKALDTHPEAYGTDAESWRKGSQASIQALLEPSPQIMVVGYFEGDTLQGCLGIKRALKPQVQHMGTLWGAYTVPEKRAQGHMQAMFAHLLEQTETWELAMLRLMYTPPHPVLEHVLPKLGFQPYGREARGICVDGEFLERLYYQKLL